MDAVKDLMEFIDRAPTAFHAASAVCDALEEAGFARLEESERWMLEAGGRYFVTRNQSSVIAFRLPESGLAPFRIVACHSDSPAFKLKPAAAAVSEGCAMLNVEKYGGMLMSTWLDRPLSIAGRLIVSEGGALRSRLVNVDEDLAIIPNVPIHFNRDANDGVAWNAQVDMQPLYGMEGADYMQIVAAHAGVARDSIAGGDLFLYNRDPARRVGAEGAFIAAPRLDDLECACTALRAFLAAAPGRHIAMYCLFDNEEVGSGTRQGADSTLLIDALRRIALAFSAEPQALEAAIAGSFMVSADNAHAAHPNHAEKYDPQNRVYMNKGVVVKSNANQKYTTDGLSAAVFERACADAGVPVQHFANRSDVAGGSTLGNISNAHASIHAVDIGLAQLAMHSACETAGALDVDYMIRALTAYYRMDMEVRGDGVVEVR